MVIMEKHGITYEQLGKNMQEFADMINGKTPEKRKRIKKKIKVGSSSIKVNLTKLMYRANDIQQSR